MASCWTIKLGWLAGGMAVAWGLSQHSSAGGEQLCCASFVCLFSCFLLFLHFLCFVVVLFLFVCFSCLFSFLLNCLYLNPRDLALLPFFSSLPFPTMLGNEQMAVWCLVACWIKPHSDSLNFCQSLENAVPKEQRDGAYRTFGCIWMDFYLQLLVSAGLFVHFHCCPDFLCLLCCFSVKGKQAASTKAGNQ